MLVELCFRLQSFMYYLRLSSKCGPTRFLRRIVCGEYGCFIAGWLCIGRQRCWSKVLVVNAQRQSNDNLWHLDPGRSAGLKEILIKYFFRGFLFIQNTIIDIGEKN